MSQSLMNQVVRVKYGHGGDKCLALAVAYVAHPTFDLQTIEGNTFSWVAYLCEPATQEEQVAYWKERALQAEAKSEARCNASS